MNNIESLELKIANFLRFGVVIAGILMFVGWMAQFKISANPFFNFETYDHIPMKDLLSFHLKQKNWGMLISYMGLVALISLPVIRVILTAILFLRQKDFILALVAIVVLVGLIISMTLGIEI